MKYCRILFVLLLFSIIFPAPSFARSTKRSSLSEIRSLYFLEPNEDLRDITDQVLKSSDTHEQVKKVIKEKKRKFYLFNYPSGGFKVRGYISFTPNSYQKPLLIILRGGMDQFGIMNPATDFSSHEDYISLGTAYRGSIYQGTDEFGGADVLDVKALIDFFPTLQEKLKIELNPSKTFMLGGSRGAMQMVLALTRYPELQNKVDKIVSLSGLFNVPKWLKTAPSYFDRYKDPTEEYPNNPVKYATQIRKDLPFLIIQGTDDAIVHLDQGLEMLTILKMNKNTVEYYERDKGNHTLSNMPFIRMKWITSWLESSKTSMN